jgi:hypothetical protein
METPCNGLTRVHGSFFLIFTILGHILSPTYLSTCLYMYVYVYICILYVYLSRQPIPFSAFSSIFSDGISRLMYTQYKTSYCFILKSVIKWKLSQKNHLPKSANRTMKMSVQEGNQRSGITSDFLKNYNSRNVNFATTKRKQKDHLLLV